MFFGLFCFETEEGLAFVILPRAGGLGVVLTTHSLCGVRDGTQGFVHAG